MNKLFEIEGELSLGDTMVTFDNNYKVYLIDNSNGDTLDVGYPNKYTGYLWIFSISRRIQTKIYRTRIFFTKY